MDIAALSIAMSQKKVRQEVNISILKKSLNQAESDGNSLVKMLEQTIQPHIGGNIDLKG